MGCYYVCRATFFYFLLLIDLPPSIGPMGF
ncbi:putative membrane protein [Burkholderia mallei]|nr:putative membrane protein [Burkholderia mallei]KOT00437.1 putative membrane protein [Burkholderia mallei]